MKTKNALFAMRTPCGNCPFKKEGAIHLAPGRVEGIIDEIMHNDFMMFHCHKTVHAKTGGEWGDDGEYTPSGNESACVGALIYQLKAGHPPVAVRMRLLCEPGYGEALLAQADDILDPITSEGERG